MVLHEKLGYLLAFDARVHNVLQLSGWILNAVERKIQRGDEKSRGEDLIGDDEGRPSCLFGAMQCAFVQHPNI